MSATVALTADFARLLGGRRFAQTLAGLCVLLAPALLVGGMLLSTDPAGALLARLRLDPRAPRRRRRRALVARLRHHRRQLREQVSDRPLHRCVRGRRRRHAAGARPGAPVALCRRRAGAGDRAARCSCGRRSAGSPFLGIVGSDVGGKAVGRSPLGFLLQQALFVGTISALVWVAGLWRLSVPAAAIPSCARWRSPMSFCWRSSSSATARPTTSRQSIRRCSRRGPVAWEAWLKRPIARGIAVAVVVIPSLFTVPFALPILSPDAAASPICRARLLAQGDADREHEALGVAQYFADMFGWREMAAAVSAVYRDLPPEERAQAVFFAPNYGEAAALDIYGRRRSAARR